MKNKTFDEVVQKAGVLKVFYRQRQWVAKTKSGTEGKGETPSDAILDLTNKAN